MTLLGSGSGSQIERIVARYALRYFISGADRDALVDETLAVIDGNVNIASNEPIEKTVARVMAHVYQGSFKLSRRS